jgi:uncharacterized protein (TIGR02145 family)
MKKIISLVFAMVITVCILQAQNDTMYVMHNGNVVFFSKVSLVDSVIFYKPKNIVIAAVTDIDGNGYDTVRIGNQTWLKQNLKTTRYRNGDIIGTTSPVTKNISGESTPKYQWAYNGNEDTSAVYGMLYTWYAVSDGRMVCPTGWHVSTQDEWSTLITFLTSNSLTGGKLKEAGTDHWDDPNTNATNETGFTGLPGGERSTNEFRYLGINTHFWTATADNATSSWTYNLGYNSGQIYGSNSPNWVGFSVRCVKD